MKLTSIYYYIFKYPLLKIRFKRIAFPVRIVSPLKIEGANNITIEDNVYIGHKVWLACLPLTGEHVSNIKIGSGTYIGNFNQIYATKKIDIGKKVLIADRVYISDNLHSYEDVNIPVIDQPIKQIGTVTIKEGAWIGTQVSIIGANIGRNAVIGANSVVLKDVPDYCVAAGVPAKIIKRYDFESKTWRKTNSEGEFEQ